jgi:tetratricopeptide (TPR) repeat protein
LRVRLATGRAAAIAALLAGLAGAAPAAEFEDRPRASEDFRLGMDAFEAERYAEARAALERAVAADPTDGRALLLLGMSELALGNADAAIGRFQAARDAEPSLEQLALYHEGLAHAQAQRGAEAREALERSIEADSGSRVAAGVRGLLAAIDSPPTARRRLRLATRVGIEFDDNVTVPEIDASSGEGDAAFVADLAGSYRFLDTERASFEAGYDFEQSLHFELSDADLRSHGLWVDGAHALGAVEAGLGYRFSTSSLGGDGFLNLHEVRPRLDATVRPGWTAELAVGYLHKNFLESSYRDRDAHHVSAGVENFFLLADRKIRMNAGLRFEAEDARGAEFDHLGFSLGGGLHVPFEWRGEWALDLAWRLRLRDYSNQTPSIGEARLDLDHGVGVALVRRITRHVEARLDYRFTGADSNLPAADYLDNTAGLTFRVSL